MDDWDKHLPQVIGAYNSTEHSTTGISPHMMLTGHEKALPLTFFYPEYEGKRTAPQTYVRDVIRRQQDLNYLCRRNTQQAQVRQTRRFDKRTADAKAYSVGDYVWVFQEVVPPKRNQEIIKKIAWSISDNRGAPRRSFLSIEHWMISSLQKHQTTQCLVRGLVHPSGNARGRLFDSGSCL